MASAPRRREAASRRTSSTSRGPWSERGRWAAAAAHCCQNGSLATRGAAVRARARSRGPGVWVRSARMPEGRAAAQAFRFPPDPAGLEAGALMGHCVWTSTPVSLSPPSTLALQSHRPVLQASMDVEQKEGRVHALQAICWGVPPADFGVLGGPLRGSGNENAT